MERFKMACRRLGQFCPVMIFFHFPCPGCGMTRALLHGFPAELS